MIDITNREFIYAFKMHRRCSAQVEASGSKRLIQFYAVECGLKALYMKNERKRLASECPYFKTVQHDIRQLLQDLKLSPKLYSKITKVTIVPIEKKGKSVAREVLPADYNQMWRYGASCKEDAVLEEELNNIIEKIAEELR